MSASPDDCYFYYYSSCNKGSLCGFRHCEAALGSEVVCDLWREKRCFRPVCKFRHMEMQKPRSSIPCYWETQPGGCTKAYCAFMHVGKGHGAGSSGFTPGGSQILDDDVTMTSPVQHPVVARRSSADQQARASPELPVVQVQQVVINPFEEESDQESVSSTPVKRPVMERLQELKVPNKPSFVSLKRKADSNVETTASEETELGFGVKSLEDIRNEKLAQARKLVEEANKLLADSGSNTMKIAPATPTAVKKTVPMRTVSPTKGAPAAQQEPPKKIVKLVSTKKALAGSALPVLSYEEIQREKALQSMLKRRQEKEREAAELLRKEKAAKESVERALRKTAVSRSSFEERDSTHRRLRRPSSESSPEREERDVPRRIHHRGSGDTRRLQRRSSDSPGREDHYVESTRRIIVSKDDRSPSRSPSPAPARQTVRDRLKTDRLKTDRLKPDRRKAVSVSPSRPSIRDRLGNDKAKPATASGRASIKGRLGHKPTAQATVKDRLGVNTTAEVSPKTWSDDDSLSVSSLSSDESIPDRPSPDDRRVKRRDKFKEEKNQSQASSSSSSSDSEDSLGHIEVKSLEDIRKEKALRTLKRVKPSTTEDSRDSESEDSVDRLPVKSLEQIRKEKASRRTDTSEGSDAAAISRKIEGRKLLLTRKKGSKKQDTASTDWIAVKSLSQIRKEKQKQKEAAGTEEEDVSDIEKIQVQSLSQIKKERKAQREKDEVLSNFGIRTLAELRQGKPAKKKPAKAPVIVRRVKIADDDSTTNNSGDSSDPVKAMAEEIKKREKEEVALLKSMERREKALRKAQNWNRRALAEHEEKEKQKDIEVLTRKIQRQPKQIYKPPSLRRKEKDATEEASKEVVPPVRVKVAPSMREKVAPRRKSPVAQVRPKMKPPPAEEENVKPAAKKTSTGWGSMTYSELMREKQLLRQQRLHQQEEDSLDGATAETSPNDVEKKPKRTYTPIVFDSGSGSQPKKPKPSIAPITFGGDSSADSTSKITVKTKPVKLPIVFKDSASSKPTTTVQKRKSSEALASTAQSSTTLLPRLAQDSTPEADSASTPTGPASRKISLRRSISKSSPADRRASAEKKRRTSAASQKSDSGNATQAESKVDDDLFEDELLEDLLGEIDDVDVVQNSKTEDELLLEMEELLA